MTDQSTPPPQVGDERTGSKGVRYVWSGQAWVPVVWTGRDVAVTSLVVIGAVILGVLITSLNSGPNFVVVNTDWRHGSTAGSWSAHGIFRNEGASGSAVVTFSNGTRNVAGDETCTAVARADAGQRTEAACELQMLLGPRGAQPMATVSR